MLQELFTLKPLVFLYFGLVVISLSMLLLNIQSVKADDRNAPIRLFRLSTVDTQQQVFHLEKGHSITFPVEYIGPISNSSNISAENVTLLGGIADIDSGLLVEMVPASFQYPLPINRTAILNITATKDSHEGIYPIFLSQQMQGNQINICGEYSGTECPLIQVGNSSWSIVTHPSNQRLGIGGKAPPDWLKLDVVPDRELYERDNIVVIRCYIQNNSDQPVDLGQGLRLLLVVGNNTHSAPDGSINTSINPLFTFDATAIFSNNLANRTVPAHYQTLLVRPFYWNQLLPSGEQISRSQTTYASGGNYTLEATFQGYNDTVLHREETFTLANPKLWYVGKGAKEGMFLTYKIQDNLTNSGKPFELTINFQNHTGHTWTTLFTARYDNGTQIANQTFYLDDFDLADHRNINISKAIYPFYYDFGSTLLYASNYATRPGHSLSQLNETWHTPGCQICTAPKTTEIKTLTVPAGTYNATLVTFKAPGPEPSIWIADSLPYPIKGETLAGPSIATAQTIHEFELQQVGMSDPMTMPEFQSGFVIPLVISGVVIVITRLRNKITWH